MRLARVTGTVVATICAPTFSGRRLLVCDLETAGGEPTGDYVLAVDAVGAGAGERVLVLDEGNSARQVIGQPEAPVRAVIVGIVDAVEVRSESRRVS